ncbi:unnamed protein product [Amoebophrya sp. A120]|nr:unnamed protein product [Amoebophrya sp. A120]|eukprot:GSA120T00023746001.1
MSLEFGDLVLVIGDQHIPQRTRDLPECFKDLLQTDKIKIVLCTGNCGSKAVLDGLQGLGHEVHCVRGESDDKAILGRELPESLVVEVGAFKVGMISGYQILPWKSDAALLQWQRKLGCDVLISGHTHEARCFALENKLFLNPGSATGAAQHYDVSQLFANDFANAARALLATAVQQPSPTGAAGGPPESAATVANLNKTGSKSSAAGPEGEAATVVNGRAAASGEDKSAETAAEEADAKAEVGADAATNKEGAETNTPAEQQGTESKSDETTSSLPTAEGAEVTKAPKAEGEAADPADAVMPSGMKKMTAEVAAAAPVVAGEDSAPGEQGVPPPPPPPAATDPAVNAVTEQIANLDVAADVMQQNPPEDGSAVPAVPAAPAPLPAMGQSTPSFMLMAVQGAKVVVYVYKEENGEITVDQFDHQKF